MYKRIKNNDSTRPVKTPGPVLHFTDPIDEKRQSVVFSCPCGNREVYVVDKGPDDDKSHGISFDSQGIMHIEGSCLAKVDGKNYCHFFIKSGLVEMCEDSICPGKTLIKK